MKTIKAMLRKRRGISMAEVVIAMAAISIITAAAIALVMASISSDIKYNDRADALAACENASECVRYASDTAELSEALTKVHFVAEGTDTYTYTAGEYTVTVTVETTAEPNTTTYVIKMDGEEIYRIIK